GLIITASFGTNVRSCIAESIRPFPTANNASPNPIVQLIRLPFHAPQLAATSFNSYPGTIGIQTVMLGEAKCCHATGFDIGFALSGGGGSLASCLAERCGVGIFAGVSAAPTGRLTLNAGTIRAN